LKYQLNFHCFECRPCAGTALHWRRPWVRTAGRGHCLRRLANRKT